MYIFMNFLTATEIPAKQTEIRPGMLAKNYMLSWFFVDIIAAIPIDIIAMMMYGNSTLALPSIFKDIRILRIFKLTKLSKYN